MKQRALVAGSTGGIGGEIARILCERGWSLVLLNRNEGKGIEQAQLLTNQYPDVDVVPVQADFMDLDTVRAACASLAEEDLKLDALLSISGLLTATKTMSRQGFESHYAVNTLATYDLIRHSIPLLTRDQNEPPAVVLTMSSSTLHRVRNLDLDILANPDKIGGLAGAYARSKLALTVMGAAWADELKAQNILIRSVDPGPTMTPMIERGDGIPFIIKLLSPLLFKDASQQAEKALNPLSPDAFGGRTGTFFAEGQEKNPPKPVMDRDLQSRLMKKLEQDAGPSSSRLQA